MEETRCKNCRHCMEVCEEFPVRVRGVCLTRRWMIGLQDMRPCFESKVPYVPTLPPDFPRLLNLEVLKELNLMVCQFTDLLKALELQPKVGPGDPGAEHRRRG